MLDTLVCGELGAFGLGPDEAPFPGAKRFRLGRERHVTPRRDGAWRGGTGGGCAREHAREFLAAKVR